MEPQKGISTAALILSLAVASAATLGVWATWQARTASATVATPATVLFLCPHGAAKSVLASAYFQRLAQERGLNVRVASAGIEPDAQVAPAVASHLVKHGYSVPTAKPRQVTPSDVEAADVVISIGCDLKGLPAPKGTLVRWDEVPLPSADFAGSDAAIRKRVIELVDELIKQRDARARSPNTQACR